MTFISYFYLFLLPKKRGDRDYDDLAKDFFHKYKNIINKDDYNDQEYEDKDNFGSVETEESKKISKSERKRLEKIKNMRKNQEAKSKRAAERLLNSCSMCITNNRMWEEQIISCGTTTMLMLPKQSTLIILIYY